MLHIFFVILFAALISADSQMHFWMGNASSYVTHARTTLYLPATPKPLMRHLSLWPGLGTTDGLLIQTVSMSAANVVKESASPTCVPWCIGASYYAPSAAGQIFGARVPAKPGAAVTIDYHYDPKSQRYFQDVKMGGKIVSRMSNHGAVGKQWYIGVESHEGGLQGTSPAHVYGQTTIWLAKPEPGLRFSKKLQETSFTPPVTRDGGRSWHIDTIRIGKVNFGLPDG